MSIEESIRSHYLPKRVKQPQLRSSESWWCKPGESQLTPEHRQAFYAEVARKQAELNASRFGTLASMIVGPSDAEMRSQSERWKKRKGTL